MDSNLNNNIFSQQQNYIPQQQQQQNISNMNMNSNSNINPYLQYNSTPSNMNCNTNSYAQYNSTPSNINPLERVNIKATDMESVERKSDDIVALVVTIFGGSSYDSLFRSVPQLSPDGIVAVYQMSISYTNTIIDKFEKTLETDKETEILNDLFKNINNLDPTSIVFNWECSSVCSSNGFAGVSKDTIKLISIAIEHGFMVMCSDFSVKALIHDWDSELLGPNPFIKISEFGGSFEIQFDNKTLSDCASSQLQKLAELCDDGSATVHALGGTIAFTADENIYKNTNAYEFSLLTLQTVIDGVKASQKTSTLLTLNSHKGLVGHAILAYPSGGLLLVSSGHWIELSRVNTSEEAVLRVASSMYGNSYANEMQTKISNASSDSEKASVLNFYSAQMIQNSTPAQYSKKC